MKTKNLFALVVAGGLALAFAAPSTVLAQGGTAPVAPRQPDKEHKKDTGAHKDTGKQQPKKDETGTHEKKAKVGEKAPTFTLTDTDGKTVNLADLTKAKKIVVLEWFNPECPYVKKHYEGDHKTMIETAKAYKDKNVVWLTINTGASKEDLAKAKKDWKIESQILMDADGSVAKNYGSKNTPTMYIINSDGVLAYHGAIDDDNSTDNKAKTNYVKNALEQLVKGETVTTSETKPYGCAVKYPKKG